MSVPKFPTTEDGVRVDEVGAYLYHRVGERMDEIGYVYGWSITLTRSRQPIVYVDGKSVGYFAAFWSKKSAAYRAMMQEFTDKAKRALDAAVEAEATEATAQ